MQETRVQFLGWEYSLEKEMATHSSILAWRIPWTEKPSGLQSMGLQESDTTLWLNHHHHLDLLHNLGRSSSSHFLFFILHRIYSIQSILSIIKWCNFIFIYILQSLLRLKVPWEHEFCWSFTSVYISATVPDTWHQWWNNLRFNLTCSFYKQN